MPVYVDWDSCPYYYLVDKGSISPERERAVEVPNELVARYKKAQKEYGEVQELLREIWDWENNV